MKYRLIKEYPTSPTLDTVVYYNNGRFWYQDNDKPFEFTNDVILHYPEYWQPETNWISKLTNSPKGSIHWLTTIMGRHLRIGEALTRRIEDFDNLQRWGIGLQQSSEEIMDYFKDKLK